MSRQIGRPTKFNEKVSERIIELAKAGKTDREISEIIGIHETTLGNWKGKNQEFFWALNEAKQAADDLVEASLFQRAIGYSHPDTKWFQHEGQAWCEQTVKHYPPDPTACIFWLKNRRPDEWREKVDMEINAGVSLVDAMKEAKERAQRRLSQLTAIDVVATSDKPVTDESGETLVLPIGEK